MLYSYTWATMLVDLVLDTVGQQNAFILTTPSDNPDSAAGKTRWINAYFPVFSNRMILTPWKYVCANRESILIDDRDKTVKQFRKHGGHAITFPQIWNMNHQWADDRMEYTVNMLRTFVAGREAK